MQIGRNPSQLTHPNATALKHPKASPSLPHTRQSGRNSQNTTSKGLSGASFVAKSRHLQENAGESQISKAGVEQTKGRTGVNQIKSEHLNLRRAALVSLPNKNIPTLHSKKEVEPYPTLQSEKTPPQARSEDISQCGISQRSLDQSPQQEGLKGAKDTNALTSSQQSHDLVHRASSSISRLSKQLGHRKKFETPEQEGPSSLPTTAKTHCSFTWSKRSPSASKKFESGVASSAQKKLFEAPVKPLASSPPSREVLAGQSAHPFASYYPAAYTQSVRIGPHEEPFPHFSFPCKAPSMIGCSPNGYLPGLSPYSYGAHPSHPYGYCMPPQSALSHVHDQPHGACRKAFGCNPQQQQQDIKDQASEYLNTPTPVTKTAYSTHGYGYDSQFSLRSGLSSTQPAPDAESKIQKVDQIAGRLSSEFSKKQIIAQGVAAINGLINQKSSTSPSRNGLAFSQEEPEDAKLEMTGHDESSDRQLYFDREEGLKECLKEKVLITNAFRLLSQHDFAEMMNMALISQPKPDISINTQPSSSSEDKQQTLSNAPVKRQGSDILSLEAEVVQKKQSKRPQVKDELSQPNNQIVPVFDKSINYLELVRLEQQRLAELEQQLSSQSGEYLTCLELMLKTQLVCKRDAREKTKKRESKEFLKMNKASSQPTNPQQLGAMPTEIKKSFAEPSFKTQLSSLSQKVTVACPSTRLMDDQKHFNCSGSVDVKEAPVTNKEIQHFSDMQPSVKDSESICSRSYISSELVYAQDQVKALTMTMKENGKLVGIKKQGGAGGSGKNGPRKQKTHRRNANEIPKDFKCMFCDKKFGTEAATIMHMRKKHDAGTKQDIERKTNIRIRDHLLLNGATNAFDLRPQLKIDASECE